MNSSTRRVTLALLDCVILHVGVHAAEEGFTTILDKDHTSGWQYVGDGEMKVRDGVATTPSRDGARYGLYWYRAKSYADFTLRLEFSIDTAGSNSGILVRFPDPKGEYQVAESKGYEVDIYGDKTGTIVAPPKRTRPIKIVPLRPGNWNECEVTATGQHYVVRLNGQVVNEYTGDRALSGYIGLQNWKGEGNVHFRNVRVKEIASAGGGRTTLPDPAETTGPSFIEILSEQAPNALEWALAPLDRTTPADIRQNLMVLRENLLDERAKQPAGAAEAYKLGQQLCNELISTFNERDRVLVRAGYTAAQAAVNTAITSEPRGSRGSPQMRWPQYFKDKDQRQEMRQQKEDSAALAKQRPALEWAERAAQLRKNVDLLYARFREATRQAVRSRER